MRHYPIRRTVITEDSQLTTRRDDRKSDGSLEERFVRNAGVAYSLPDSYNEIVAIQACDGYI